MIATSCSKEDDLKAIENQDLKVDAFFEKVSNMNLKIHEDNLIVIDYIWNKKDRTIKIVKTEEREASWVEAFTILEEEFEFAGRKKDVRNSPTVVSAKKYTIYCNKGRDKNDKAKGWRKGCSKTISCGKMVVKCLDEGGCGNICKNKMRYHPDTKTFLLGKGLEED